jgi:hypothetical protein
LFERSAILTRAAHARELAADQLREAPAHGSWSKCSVEIHSAAMTAMHGALGALELSGEYRLAGVLEDGGLEDAHGPGQVVVPTLASRSILVIVEGLAVFVSVAAERHDPFRLVVALPR